MTKTSTLILDKKKVFQIVKRIAFEIYEKNHQEKKLIIAGIPESGYMLAEYLMKELKEISPIELYLVKVNVNKKDPASNEVTIDCDKKLLRKTALILVDDVLNTGRTFLYALKPIIDADVKKVQTVALVDRGHSLFPISSDFTGYELSTTLKEHVEVVLKKGSEGVYLY